MHVLRLFTNRPGTSPQSELNPRTTLRDHVVRRNAAVLDQLFALQTRRYRYSSTINIYTTTHRSSFFPLTISAKTKTIWPPSSPGTGSELMTARLMEMTAMNCRRADGPSCWATSAPTLTISTGPELSPRDEQRIARERRRGRETGCKENNENQF